MKGSACTVCREHNFYQDQPFICYACRMGWFPKSKLPVSVPIKQPTLAIKCTDKAGKCGGLAVEKWVSKYANFFMCQKCIDDFNRAYPNDASYKREVL